MRSISNKISFSFCIPLLEFGNGLEFGKPVKLNSRLAQGQRELLKMRETSLDQASESVAF